MKNKLKRGWKEGRNRISWVRMEIEERARRVQKKEKEQESKEREIGSLVEEKGKPMGGRKEGRKGLLGALEAEGNRRLT